MSDTKLGRTFWLSEFTVSATAARMGREIVAPPEVIPNIERLVEHLLQPLRDALRRPITLISGYRPPWLNKAVGGSAKSAHMFGGAADIIVPGMATIDVIRKVRELDLPFDQAIEEFGRWVHLGVPAEGSAPRLQVLQARKVNGRTVYSVIP